MKNVLAISLILLAVSGCGVTLKHDASAGVTYTSGHIGLKEATIVEWNAELPAKVDFTAEAKSGLGSWVLQKGLEHYDTTENLLVKVVKWATAWIK